MARDRKFRSRLAILGVVMALLASACGGSSDDAGGAADEPTVEESEEVEAEAEDSSETDEVDTDDAETEPETGEQAVVEETEEAIEESTDEPEDVADSDIDDGDEGGNLVIQAEYQPLCDAANELDAQTANLNDPVAGFSLIADAYGDFAELSPDPELSADLIVIANVSGQIVEIFNDPDIDIFDPEGPAVSEIEALTTPEVEAAGTRVETTLAEVCGSGPSTTSTGETVDETVGERITLDGPGEFTGSLTLATYNVYEIEVPEATVLTVTMSEPTGVGIDAFLAIIDPNGAEQTHDDLGATATGDFGFTDSQITIDEAVGGVYVIEAHSYRGEGDGEFVLTVTFE